MHGNKRLVSICPKTTTHKHQTTVLWSSKSVDLSTFPEPTFMKLTPSLLKLEPSWSMQQKKTDVKKRDGHF